MAKLGNRSFHTMDIQKAFQDVAGAQGETSVKFEKVSIHGHECGKVGEQYVAVGNMDFYRNNCVGGSLWVLAEDKQTIFTTREKEDDANNQAPVIELNFKIDGFDLFAKDDAASTAMTTATTTVDWKLIVDQNIQSSFGNGDAEKCYLNVSMDPTNAHQFQTISLDGGKSVRVAQIDFVARVIEGQLDINYGNDAKISYETGPNANQDAAASSGTGMGMFG